VDELSPANHGANMTTEAEMTAAHQAGRTDARNEFPKIIAWAMAQFTSADAVASYIAGWLGEMRRLAKQL